MQMTQKLSFLHAMSQDKDALAIRNLIGLQGIHPQELLAQLTCSEFIQMVEQLRTPHQTGVPSWQ